MERIPKSVIENLNFTYDDGTESLLDVNFTIYASEITVIFGPASGGKSTLLRVINRLNDLADGMSMSGRVLLDGQDIYAKDVNVTALRRKVGIVFAQPYTEQCASAAKVDYGTTDGVAALVQLRRGQIRDVNDAVSSHDIQKTGRSRHRQSFAQELGECGRRAAGRDRTEHLTIIGPQDAK